MARNAPAGDRGTNKFSPTPGASSANINQTKPSKEAAAAAKKRLRLLLRHPSVLFVNLPHPSPAAALALQRHASAAAQQQQPAHLLPPTPDGPSENSGAPPVSVRDVCTIFTGARNELRASLGTRCNEGGRGHERGGDGCVHGRGRVDESLPPAFVYYALHKPRHVLCENNDSDGDVHPSRGAMTHRKKGNGGRNEDDNRRRRTVYDILPPGIPHVPMVGRLDYDSEGLLLLTDDGVLSAALSNPTFGAGFDRAGRRNRKLRRMARRSGSALDKPTEAEEGEEARSKHGDASVPTPQQPQKVQQQQKQQKRRPRKITKTYQVECDGLLLPPHPSSPLYPSLLSNLPLDLSPTHPYTDEKGFALPPTTVEEQLQRLVQPFRYDNSGHVTVPAKVRLLRVGPQQHRQQQLHVLPNDSQGNGESSSYASDAAASETFSGRIWLEFQMSEGRNRQIRRLCRRSGLTVLTLRRTEIDGVTLYGEVGAIRSIPRRIVAGWYEELLPERTMPTVLGLDGAMGLEEVDGGGGGWSAFLQRCESDLDVEEDDAVAYRWPDMRGYVEGRSDAELWGRLGLSAPSVLSSERDQSSPFALDGEGTAVGGLQKRDALVDMVMGRLGLSK